MTTILTGDCRETLKTLQDGSVNCCITSPPYFGLRCYGHEKQIGKEKTPEAFVSELVSVFREVKRVLRDDGTLWLNLGDSYNSSPAGNKTPCGFSQTRPSRRTGNGDQETVNTGRKLIHGLKSKDLIGIPWMVAFALRADGWYLRQDIIWSKPNPMPESVTDRCTKAHEYIFMLSKSARYYYDHEAIKTPAKNPDDDIRRLNQQKNGNKSEPSDLQNGLRPRPDKQRGHSRRLAGFNDRWGGMTGAEQRSLGANKRSVWHVATRPYKGSHFATFPPDLIRPCVLAGCPAGGTILDPFGGSGTTAQVANEHERNAVLCELNPEYIPLIEKRLGIGMEDEMFN